MTGCDSLPAIHIRVKAAPVDQESCAVATAPEGPGCQALQPRSLHQCASEVPASSHSCRDGRSIQAVAIKDAKVQTCSGWRPVAPSPPASRLLPGRRMQNDHAVRHSRQSYCHGPVTSASSSRSPFQNRRDGVAPRKTILAGWSGRNRRKADRTVFDLGRLSVPPGVGWNGPTRNSSSRWLLHSTGEPTFASPTID